LEFQIVTIAGEMKMSIFEHAVYLSDEVPYWDGKLWIYKGVEYRSLRELKTKSSFKLEKFLYGVLAQEIRNEMDADIMNATQKVLSQEVKNEFNEVFGHLVTREYPT
jgi:hypothetical protein